MATRLQAAAAAELEIKLATLTSIVMKAQNGSPLPDGTPTTRRKFLAWRPVGPDGEQLGKNANDTLKKHATLLKSVEDVVAKAKELETSGLKKAHSKEDRLATSKRAQRLHWTLRMIAERALVAARKELVSAREDVALAKAKLASAEAEFKSTREALTDECSALRQENARLVLQLAKTVPLRSLR